MGIEWVVLYCRLCRLDRIGFVGWIVSYRLDCIVSAGLDRIISAGSGNTGFYTLAVHDPDGTDGLDGALVGWGWEGRTLASAGTGEPPWAPEQECHCWLLRGGGLCEVVAGTNYVGAAMKQSICVGEAK